MKKLIILIIALALCLTACSKPEFFYPEDGRMLVKSATKGEKIW
jgi:hypothetical protein